MDPRPPDSSTEDALRRLEARLERASDVAERLFSEAASEATSAALRMGGRLGGRAAGRGEPAGDDGPPAQGWQIPGQDDPGPERNELELLVAAWNSVRELVPPELRQRLAEAIKEVLLAVRALIDWYLERIERRAAQPIRVQDIPVL